MGCNKRLIVCCDGTWMDADSQDRAPSNVTRISRLFSLTAEDGFNQIIDYHSGVGTGSNKLDSVLGGAFGVGVEERLRDAYYSICANYAEGDEIILIGFSRGAFTARSVAGVIANIGLLTGDGMDDFEPIFQDIQRIQMSSGGPKDAFLDRPFTDKPTTIEGYRAKLVAEGLTRIKNPKSGTPIKVKAVGVWDTVGSLGIPQTAWMKKVNLWTTRQYEFYDTVLSDTVENGFQALALDETRPPFSPAVWELPAGVSTNLQQCWFPGNHTNCGGGWPDQGVADLSLAWMMDQLASVGVGFDQANVAKAFARTTKWYEKNGTAGLKWAKDEFYNNCNNKKVRPWGLGAIQSSSNAIYVLAGTLTRSPGQYLRMTADTNSEIAGQYLQNTNEHIHASARVRMHCGGLALDDKGVWKNPALADWKLVHVSPAQSGASTPAWAWDYQGKKPLPTRRLPEATLGPYERQYLKLRAEEAVLEGLALGA